MSYWNFAVICGAWVIAILESHLYHLTGNVGVSAWEIFYIVCALAITFVLCEPSNDEVETTKPEFNIDINNATVGPTFPVEYSELTGELLDGQIHFLEGEDEIVEVYRYEAANDKWVLIS